MAVAKCHTIIPSAIPLEITNPSALQLSVLMLIKPNILLIIFQLFSIVLHKTLIITNIQYMRDRLLKFIKEKGISQNAFEDRSGLARGTMTTLNKGIRSDKLAGICKAYPDLNIYYVLGLSDDMYRNDSHVEDTPIVEGYSASSKCDNALHEPKNGHYEQDTEQLKGVLRNVEKLLDQRNTEVEFMRSEIEHKNQIISFFINKQ